MINLRAAMIIGGILQNSMSFQNLRMACFIRRLLQNCGIPNPQTSHSGLFVIPVSPCTFWPFPSRQTSSLRRFPLSLQERQQAGVHSYRQSQSYRMPCPPRLFP